MDSFTTVTERNWVASAKSKPYFSESLKRASARTASAIALAAESDEEHEEAEESAEEEEEEVKTAKPEAKPEAQPESQVQTRPILAPLVVPRDEEEEPPLTHESISKMPAQSLRLLAERHGIEIRVGTKLIGKDQLVRTVKEKLNL